MAKPYNITILNGEGTANILNGNYTVTSTTKGYSDASIDPAQLNVVEGTNIYQLTISADGTLTLHVTENGEATGTAVVGAKFIRCDANGTTYGDEITTDSNGDAKFLNVPYDSTSAPLVYYKQTASDGSHEFDDTLKNISLESQTKTIEIMNRLPEARTFKLTDKNYSGLPIASGSIILN